MKDVCTICPDKPDLVEDYNPLARDNTVLLCEVCGAQYAYATGVMLFAPWAIEEIKRLRTRLKELE